MVRVGTFVRDAALGVRHIDAADVLAGEDALPGFRCPH
jgi:hypothetical protein